MSSEGEHQNHSGVVFTCYLQFLLITKVKKIIKDPKLPYFQRITETQGSKVLQVLNL